MITLSPTLLTDPAAVQALASELLNLRFDRARLTEALLAIQDQAAAAGGPPARPADPEVLARRLEGKEWRIDIT